MAGKEDGPSKANGVSKADDKGKGKVEDLKEQQGADQEMKDKDVEEKDGKVLPPGTPPQAPVSHDDDHAACMSADLEMAEELSEEDQKLKDDLDMLVERLLVRRVSMPSTVTRLY